MIKTRGWPNFLHSKARLVITGQMTETIQNGCAIKFLLNLVVKDSLLFYLCPMLYFIMDYLLNPSQVYAIFGQQDQKDYGCLQSYLCQKLFPVSGPEKF